MNKNFSEYTQEKYELIIKREKDIEALAFLVTDEERASAWQVVKNVSLKLFRNDNFIAVYIAAGGRIFELTIEINDFIENDYNPENIQVHFVDSPTAEIKHTIQIPLSEEFKRIIYGVHSADEVKTPIRIISLVLVPVNIDFQHINDMKSKKFNKRSISSPFRV